MLAVGSKAPAFRVKDHLGREVSLADLAGKNVILWFYPKADTPGCTIEGCGYRDLSGDFEKKNAVILGVSFDTIEENAAFAAKMQFPYRLLCDTDRAIGMAYGACSKPTDASARRISYIIGPDGSIKQSYPKVDTKSHPAEVLKAL